MNEQTTPDAGVSQEPTIEQRAQAYAGKLLESQSQEVEQPEDVAPEPVEQPEGQVETAEVTPDDIPDDNAVEQPEAVDAFEIVHNGQQVKLSRADIIKHAQQGFDYTRKTEAVAVKDRQVESQLQKLHEIEQVQPHLTQSLGVVKAYEAQLAQYQKVDWVRVATDDPMGYPAARAQFEQLRDSYNQARYQHDQQSQAVKQRLDAIAQERLQAEDARLPEFIPEWKDAAKKDAGKQALVKYFADQGIPMEALGHKLNDALSVSIAVKAMKYDQLMKAKTEKVKQLRTAPPVTVPGAKQSQTAQADRDVKLRENLKKTGDRNTAAALLLNRMK